MYLLAASVLSQKCLVTHWHSKLINRKVAKSCRCIALTTTACGRNWTCPLRCPQGSQTTLKQTRQARRLDRPGHWLPIENALGLSVTPGSQICPIMPEPPWFHYVSLLSHVVAVSSHSSFLFHWTLTRLTWVWIMTVLCARISYHVWRNK